VQLVRRLSAYYRASVAAEDGELLAAWRAGDRRAGSTLFDRHYRAVRRFLPKERAISIHGTAMHFSAEVDEVTALLTRAYDRGNK